MFFGKPAVFHQTTDQSAVSGKVAELPKFLKLAPNRRPFPNSEMLPFWEKLDHPEPASIPAFAPETTALTITVRVFIGCQPMPRIYQRIRAIAAVLDATKEVEEIFPQDTLW